MINKLILIVILYSISGCVDEFQIPNEVSNQSSLLVIEALLTDEFKNHEIKLSRSTSLGIAETNYEAGAQVVIEDDKDDTYTFTEASEGLYISDIEFSAQTDRLYKLSILTT